MPPYITNSLMEKMHVYHIIDLGPVLLKVVTPNVDVNVDVDVTYDKFAFY